MYLGDYLGFSPEPWSWMIPLILAITFFMTLVTGSLWFLKQILIALGAPISSGNHARTQQANEERSSPVDLNKALESRILDALPTSKFEGENEEDELVGRQKECAICLGEFEAGEWLRRIPSCDHTFHMACIDTWFRSHSTCPVCRSDVCCSGESKEC